MAPLAPKIRKITRHGLTRWIVDLRAFNAGRPSFETQAAAQAFLTDTLAEQAEHGQLAFELPHETRRRYLAAEVRLNQMGATLEHVIDWYSKTHRPTHTKLLNDAIKECLTAKTAAGRREHYVRHLGYALESFKRWISDDRKLCSEVTVKEIESWLADLHCNSGTSTPTPWLPKTKQGNLLKLGAFFTFCLKREWVPSNPATKVEAIVLDQKPPGILTVSQVKKLFRLLKQPKHRRITPYFALCTFAGLRASEAQKIQWDAVNLKTGYVEIRSKESKTRQRRLIKLQPNAIRWLKLGGDLPPKCWQERSEALRIEAGFATKKGIAGTPWPKNAMRHSFCSYSLPVHGASQTAAWAGHSESMLFKHYRELVTLEAAREFWSITPESITKSPAAST